MGHLLERKTLLGILWFLKKSVTFFYLPIQFFHFSLFFFVIFQAVDLFAWFIRFRGSLMGRFTLWRKWIWTLCQKGKGTALWLRSELLPQSETPILYCLRSVLSHQNQAISCNFHLTFSIDLFLLSYLYLLLTMFLENFLWLPNFKEFFNRSLA